LLFKLKVYINNFRYARKFFTHPHLLMAYTFQNIYVGQDPYQSPALFSMIPAAELTEGSYSPDGGMFAIVEKLMTAAKEAGVLFHFDSPVAEILTCGPKAEGIRLQNGTRITSGVIVANADLPFVYRRLLPDKRKSEKIDRLKYSCSAVSFHWAIDKTYPQLSRHNVFLTDDYRAGLRAIFREKSVGSNPCFYVHAPGKFDNSAAPPGHESLSVVVGSGHIDPLKNQDWEAIKQKTRRAVIDRLKKFGLEDIESHIRSETCILPADWEDTCNITNGSVFGSLAHNIFQMGYFRPHNQHSRYKNLFFTGGSTQPGNGIPNVLLSAKLTSERILGKTL